MISYFAALAFFGYWIAAAIAALLALVLSFILGLLKAA
jgi:tetrahydromethanopterin S-methyltransferase subunit B